MRPFKSLVACSLVSLSVLSASTTFASSDCPNTPWEPRNGRTCASLGLDSHKSVCRKGDEYAMNCDDTKDQIRLCATNQRCDTHGARDTPENNAESACMTAVNDHYKGNVKTISITNSDFSQAGTVVSLVADGKHWRCLASNDGHVEELNAE